ncbi:MAG: hypothetical protein ACR2OZ_09315 [Verrucomicrobiales bacterium]
MKPGKRSEIYKLTPAVRCCRWTDDFSDKSVAATSELEIFNQIRALSLALRQAVVIERVYT